MLRAPPTACSGVEPAPPNSTRFALLVDELGQELEKLQGPVRRARIGPDRRPGGRRSNLGEQRRRRGRDALSRRRQQAVGARRPDGDRRRAAALHAQLERTVERRARLQHDGVAGMRGIDRRLQIAAGVHREVAAERMRDDTTVRATQDTTRPGTDCFKGTLLWEGRTVREYRQVRRHGSSTGFANVFRVGSAPDTRPFTTRPLPTVSAQLLAAVWQDYTPCRQYTLSWIEAQGWADDPALSL